MKRKEKQVVGLGPARGRAAMWLTVALVLLGTFWILRHPWRGEDELLVVAYDASRDYLRGINEHLEGGDSRASGWVKLSHSGSVDQAKGLIRGLMADVVYLASEAEMRQLERENGCLDTGWHDRFPYGGSPAYSTIVILLRADAAKGITGWRDLYRRDVRWSLPDPRTSGCGRYAYLVLVADALRRHEGAEISAMAEVRDLLLRAELIPLGAHQAFASWSRKGRGDAFLTWENEALRIVREHGPDRYKVVYPDWSLMAEPVLGVMECYVDRRGSREEAGKYIEFLFSPEGQAIAAASGMRPRDPGAESAFPGAIPEISLSPVEDIFGSWEEVWERHLGPESSFAHIVTLRAARAGGAE